MAKRTTVKVSELVADVNRMLKDSTCDAKVREGMIAVLENMLHATGQYRGFGYLDQKEVPAGEKAGIIRDVYGANHHTYPDETRRYYI